MSQGLGPITGIIAEDQVVLDFGDYEGRSLYEIAYVDPEFYSSLITEKERGNILMIRDKCKIVKLTLIESKNFN